MPSISEKLKSGSTSATPHEVVETDHDNLHISRDQFVAKYRKKKEIAAKLEVEKQRLEELAREEEKQLEKLGQEDLVPKKETVKSEEE